MENFTKTYPASRLLPRRAHVGVVGSGDLEVLMEPWEKKQAQVHIRTGAEGFAGAWESVLERFFAVYDVAANIEINDFGATPGVVHLRLVQAWEEGQKDE